MSDQLLVILQRAIEIGVLFSLPMWLRYTLSGMMRHNDRIGYFAVPGLARLSFFSGVIFGGALLYVNHDPKYYYFDNVFAEGGPWDLSFFEFFIVWLNPLRYSPLTLWDRVSALNIHDTLTGFFITSVLFGVAAVAAAAVYFRRQFHIAMFNNFAVWLWSAALAIYVACAIAWTLNVMNFWAVVAAFMFIRHRAIHAH